MLPGRPRETGYVCDHVEYLAVNQCRHDPTQSRHRPETSSRTQHTHSGNLARENTLFNSRTQHTHSGNLARENMLFNSRTQHTHSGNLAMENTLFNIRKHARLWLKGCAHQNLHSQQAIHDLTQKIIETNKVKNECYLITQDNTIYKFWIKFSFSSIG